MRNGDEYRILGLPRREHPLTWDELLAWAEPSHDEAPTLRLLEDDEGES